MVRESELLSVGGGGSGSRNLFRIPTAEGKKLFMRREVLVLMDRLLQEGTVTGMGRILIIKNEMLIDSWQSGAEDPVSLLQEKPEEQAGADRPAHRVYVTELDLIHEPDV